MALTITDVADQQRYEAREDGELAGFAAYLDTREGPRVFTHTEVEAGFTGRGVGSRLARSAMDDLRGRSQQAVALCPFIAGWLDRHRDYADVVYERPESRVDD